jgi:hypothetical protein
MNLDFAAFLSVVHTRQRLKDIVGQWTRSQTAQTSSNDVGALAIAIARNERQHSGDKTRNLTKIFISECFALPHRPWQGEAFGYRYFRITLYIVARMLRPYRIRVFGVQRLLDSPTISLVSGQNLQLSEKQEVR